MNAGSPGYRALNRHILLVLSGAIALCLALLRLNQAFPGRFTTCASEPFCPTDLDSTCVDTDIYIRTNCLQDTAQVACDEDTCGFRSGSYRIHSDTGSVALAAGLYYFIVDGYQETTGTWLHCGDYTVTVTGVP